MKKIILLDSHAIIHRAYHGLPDFSTKSGIPTGGLFGLSSMLIKIISDLKPDYLIACYDLPKPTFRHLAYEGYKGGRAKTDEELISQIKSSREIFKAFSIPVYEAEGFEADDLLGTFSEILKKDKKNKIIIASGDMDTLQLVDKNQVVVFTLKKGINDTIIYDEEKVFERFGFGPENIIDFKGLSGDPSDNIIGISGIGEKTATKLILNFGNIENIYKKLKKSEKDFEEKGFKPRMINLLKEGEEEALFSKELATIKKDVETNFSLPEQNFNESLDLSKIGEVFRKYEFRNLLERLQKNLGLEKKEEDLADGEEEISKEKLKELKLAVHLLNPNISEPTLDDLKNFE